MKNLLRLCLIAVFMISIAACGGGDNPPPRVVIVADILSDQPADGHIAYDHFRKTFPIIENGPRTVFFGIDDSDPNLLEYRAFLDFPLDAVPINAVIVSATLELFVNEASFANVIPAWLDLVLYPVTVLGWQDFNSAPLMSIPFDFLRSDQGRYVAIDVTLLMREAQRRVLPDFQVRLLLDLALSKFGFVGIEDLPNISITAPLLTVEYYE